MTLLSTENFTGTSSATLLMRGSWDKLLSAHGPTEPIRMDQNTGCPFQNEFRQMKFRQVSRGEGRRQEISFKNMPDANEVFHYTCHFTYRVVFPGNFANFFGNFNFFALFLVLVQVHAGTLLKFHQTRWGSERRKGSCVEMKFNLQTCSFEFLASVGNLTANMMCTQYL